MVDLILDRRRNRKKEKREIESKEGKLKEKNNIEGERDIF